MTNHKVKIVVNCRNFDETTGKFIVLEMKEVRVSSLTEFKTYPGIYFLVAKTSDGLFGMYEFSTGAMLVRDMVNKKVALEQGTNKLFKHTVVDLQKALSKWEVINK